MKHGLFITGTDTDVGKTVVAAGILRLLREQGIDAVPMKPVQTGAVPVAGGELRAPDLQFCLDVAGLTPSAGEMSNMAPYCYEPACSPHLAGRMAGSYPRISRICACANELHKQHGFILVEGAGGIMVPLDESSTMLDLAQALGYPVLLVSRLGLGAINHTLLSLRALRSAGLRILGVLFNSRVRGSESDRFIRDDNPEIIAHFGKIDIIGKLRHLENISPQNETCWQQFAQDVPGLAKILKEAE